MVAFCAGNKKQQAIHVAVARRFLFPVALPTSGLNFRLNSDFSLPEN